MSTLSHSGSSGCEENTNLKRNSKISGNDSAAVDADVEITPLNLNYDDDLNTIIWHACGYYSPEFKLR